MQLVIDESSLGSVADLVSFGSLPGELSRMSALTQLRISYCDVREFVGIHRLTSLEYLQVLDALSTECRKAVVTFGCCFFSSSARMLH